MLKAARHHRRRPRRAVADRPDAAHRTAAGAADRLWRRPRRDPDQPRVPRRRTSAELYEIPEAGHTSGLAVQPKEYEARVTAFLSAQGPVRRRSHGSTSTRGDGAGQGQDRCEQQDPVQAGDERLLGDARELRRPGGCAPPKATKSAASPRSPVRASRRVNSSRHDVLEDRAPGRDAGGDADLPERRVDARRHARAARLDDADGGGGERRVGRARCRRPRRGSRPAERSSRRRGRRRA